MNMEELENQSPFVVFDSKPLNGLRGFVAVHLVLYHSLYYCVYSVSIYGAVQMPLFFLLSGFCMTLGYGKKKFTCSTICCGPCKTTLNCCVCCSCSNSCCLCCCCKNKNEDDNNEEEVVFDSWNFYKSRFTRILPVYYLTLLYALPLFFLGHLYDVRPDNWGFGIGGTILAIFLQQTVLFNTNTYFGPNGASWTVSTLFFFYWFYPSLLVFAQRQSNQRLAFFMVFSFYIECILGNSLLLLLYKPNFDIGYWISTAHPFSRIPVFFMGVCAGVLCMRIKEQDFDAMNCFGRFNNIGTFSFIEDVFLPIPCISKKICNKMIDEKYVKEKQMSWARRVNVNAGYYFLLLLVLSILNILYIDMNEVYERQYFQNSTSDESKNSTFDTNNDLKNSTIKEVELDEEEEEGWGNYTMLTYPESIDHKLFKWALPEIFGQFFLCYVQLMIIVGLCLDGGKSIFSRFFNTKPLQFLGRMSMAIYLVHEPTIFWINCIIYGPNLMSPMEGESNMPLWAVPIHIIISIIFGILLTLYVEDPARKKLNQWWNVKKI